MASSKLKTASRYLIKFSFLGLGFLALLVGCNQEEQLPFYNTSDFTAEWIKPSDVKYSDIHTIDTFTFKNQLGHRINKDSLDGHIYVANFFFTSCPSICPKMVNQMLSLQDTFANNPQIKLVSFTVLPSVDSVSRLRKYGEFHHINPSKWHLLTGDKTQIYKLGRLSYFSEKRLGITKDSSQFLHTESMLLIDQKGRIRGIYNATEAEEMQRAILDIKTLIKEQ